MPRQLDWNELPENRRSWTTHWHQRHPQRDAVPVAVDPFSGVRIAGYPMRNEESFHDTRTLSYLAVVARAEYGLLMDGHRSRLATYPDSRIADYLIT